MFRPALTLAVVIVSAPVAVQAREVGCWFEHGVVVVPARVAGVDGDFILDTGAPATVLHETRAQTAGYEATRLRGDVRVAGLTLLDRPIEVVDLDARTFQFDTPIAGVIGADVLSGQVIDIDFAPCRVQISRPGAAPAFPSGVRLALEMTSGLPVALAGVADGPRAWTGRFVIATGLDAPVRIDRRFAGVPGARRPEDFDPQGARRAILRALSVGGALFENLQGGLTPALGAEAAGAIGAAVLSQWRIRLDFAADRLVLAKKKGPPDHSEGP